MHVLLLVLGCTSASGNNESDTGPSGFCSVLDDGNTSVVEDGGGNAGAGDLEMRMLTTEDVDNRNPLYIAFKDYTLENVDMGGIQQTGQTSGDGIANARGLGPGNWLFVASFARGSHICKAELTVELKAASTTHGCAVMTCPE